MLKLDGELFQWEKNRFVQVVQSDEHITAIQFYNKKSKIGPEVEVINGKAQIPNFLLKENLPVIALACINEENNFRVVSRTLFKVIARPKPDSYIDEEDDPTEPQIPDIIYDGGVEL